MQFDGGSECGAEQRGLRRQHGRRPGHRYISLWDIAAGWLLVELPLPLPTKTYEADFILENGDVRGFYLGPSHNTDDIFVYFQKERVLYAGSILKEHLGNLASANLEEYPKTLQNLQRLHLDIDKIISGHWSAVHGQELIGQYLTMLEAFRSRKVE